MTKTPSSLKNIFRFSLVLTMIVSLSSFQEQGGKKQGQAKITPEEVNLQYNKTSKNLKRPHLFFNDSDIERIKTLITQKDPIITIGYQQLQRTANEVLKTPILIYELDDANLRIKAIHTFASQVPSLVMMYQLTKDTIYAHRAWQQLAEFSTFPDWGADRHFLDSGIGAFDFAISYDGLSDYLSTSKKTKLKNAILKNVLMPAKKQMENNVWWHTVNHNWNGICNGGMVMAALAIYEDDPETMSKIIALAADALPLYINAFEPDGQSEEGIKYWHYGLMYTTIALESMQRVLGTTFGIDNKPGFKKTGWFPLYVSGPVTSLSVGDDPIKTNKETSFFWFAKNNNDVALAKNQYDLCLENKEVSWADMIYYDPSMVKGPSKLSSIPKDNYIRGIEIMSLRENWQPNGLFVAMHGGRNSANHGHLDAGTFEIQGLGEVWAYSDLGSDDYTYPGYFSKTTKPGYNDEITQQDTAGRWHFYRLRAEGKNCLVVNPNIRPDQNEKGEAKMVANTSSENSGFYIVDLQECYNRDLISYHRGIEMDRANQMITIQDEFAPKKKSNIYWSMHTKAKIEISKDGQLATLKIGDKIMFAALSGVNFAKFEVLPASYLPGQAFPLTKNSINKGFKKLVVRLDNVTNPTTLKVDFSPIKKNLTTISKSVSSLNKW